MADPLSILGATASVLSILDVLAKTIGTINSLRSQWEEADLAMMSLTSQLDALQAALEKIREWMGDGSAELHQQLVLGIGGSINCCRSILLKIYSKLEGIERQPNGLLGAGAKMSFLLKSTEMKELQSMMDRQTAVLTLLLTTCNSKTLAEQHTVLKTPSIRDSIKQVRKDTESLIVHKDAASIRSNSTGKSSKLSVMFDFDGELFASRPYKGIIWKTIKTSIQFRKRRSFRRVNDSDAHSDEQSDAQSDALSVPEEKLLSSDINSEDVEWKSGCRNVLLLGAGEASKTTFLKQMQSIYNSSISTEDRRVWRGIIRDNLIAAFQIFLEILLERDEWAREHRASLYDISQYDSSQGDELPHDLLITFRLVAEHTLQSISRNHIQSAVRESILKGSTNPRPENLQYFLLHFERMCADDFLPTDIDIAQARVRTTGISKDFFRIGGDEYTVYDVGGERSERKKWIKVFNNVSLVLFFVPMSGYDQPLYEDASVNQMNESLMLFESISEAKWFDRTTVILCFTKMDMFIKKIRTGSTLLQEEYPEYEGGDRDVNAAQEFFTQKFEALAKRTNRKLPRVQYFDATRIDRVRCVLDYIFKDGGPLPSEKANTGDTDDIPEMDEADWQDLEVAWSQKIS